MKIVATKIFVDNQNKALEFYIKKLGFIKKSDVTSGKYRWLTVVSPDDKNGVELLLEKNDNSAAKIYQKALYEQKIPAMSFAVADIYSEHKKLKNLGVKFTTEPTEVMKGVTIAIFDDNCGNLIQIQQIER